MALHWLFPTPVLQVDLEPDAATAAAMQQQLEQFDAQVYQHPEFSDRNNLTGDLLGHAGLDQLHRIDAFQWLNGQLAEHVSGCRRLHDVGKSGWWQLISFTIIGLIPLIIWLASDTHKKKNQFGPVPKN